MSDKVFSYSVWGIALVGTAAVNYAYRRLQKFHKRQDYCSAPVEKLKTNEKCVQLLGGVPIKIKTINLKKCKVEPLKAIVEFPVAGNLRHGQIYTMSTKVDDGSSWEMQYAIFHIRVKEKSWVIWLHPKEGLEKFAGEIPDCITKHSKTKDMKILSAPSKDSSSVQFNKVNSDKNIN